MDEAMLEKQLDELIRQMGPSPDPSSQKLVSLARKSYESRKQIKNSISRLQDSIDCLRMSVKYLMFDLEATRRENAYLKSLLQNMD